MIRLPVHEIIRKPAFPGKVGFAFDPAYGPLIDAFISHISWTGILATVTITRPFRARTTGERSQNHHLNGHVQQICVETGNDFEAVKMYIKSLAVSQGYPFRTLPNGIPWPVSEADSSTEQCAILIEVAHQVAAEWGVALIESED